METRVNSPTNQEIVEYYGQIWENTKHIDSFVRALCARYEKEVSV